MFIFYSANNPYLKIFDNSFNNKTENTKIVIRTIHQLERECEY